MSGDLAVRLAHQPSEPVALTIAGLRGLGDAAVLLLLKDNSEEAKLKRQVAQATKMQVVGQLAGGVAHDFNNILTAIIGHCDLMLMRHTPGDSDYDDIQQIKSNSNRAAGLTRQLLAFSRQQTLRPQVLQLPAVVSEVSHLLKRLLGETVELVVKHGRSLGPIRADPGQLEQVIINLAGNAVKFTERGSVTVHVTSQGETDNRVRLKFSVRDTGIGIAPEAQARIFESFTQADESTSRRFGGTGLGTTIAKQLVELMDGELRVEQGGVEAGPDAGTTFGFTILGESLPGAVATTLLTLEAMRVLVIAADPTEKRVLALQVEQWGATATSATPEEALGAIQVGRPFDIALIEHRPPSIDGLEISTSLRSLRRPEQMPIVLIASASPGPAEAAAADGGVIQATLTKPVPPRTLHDVMIQLGGRGAQPHVAQQVEPGQLRVLIADDNALNQNLLKRLVTKLGHTADVVSNGREAVASVAQQAYDALLMDVLMPEMDGLVAAEAICRRWPRGNRPRLIALTAMAGPGDQERCLRAGFDDYMSKPVRLDDLNEALKAAAGYRTNRETAGL